MTTPVWVITGLLDSGEAILINQLIEQELDEQDILVIQFESGETSLTEQERMRGLVFSKNQLEQIPFGITDAIIRYTDRHNSDLVLVEQNGMEHFRGLEEILLQFTAKVVLSVERVVYTADGASFKTRIPDVGAAAFPQVTKSDYAYVRLRGHRRSQNSTDVLYNCNPDIRVYTSRDRFVRAPSRFGMKPRHCFLMILTVVMLYMMVFPLLNEVRVPSGRYVSILLGVFLQTAPFLTTGVLLSSPTQVYLRTDWTQRGSPGKILAGQFFAVIANFYLPVCDCTSVPVFKSLIEKGVPVPAAVILMPVSPITNPVIILPTWYALNGNYKIVAARCGLGILCAVLCRLTYLFKPLADYLTEQAMSFQAVRAGCSLPAEAGTQLSRPSLMMRYAQNEFFSVGKFLLIGIFASTLSQDMILQAVAAGGIGASWKAPLVMMGLAFVLSLRSSSDAVVARNMVGSLPAGAILGFTVFGPMMGIKNAAMLLSGFKSGFVIRLFATTLPVCFVVTGVFITGESGGIGI